MITWIVRYAILYAIPLAIGGALSAGGFSAWLAGWTDYKSAILMVIVIGVVLYAITTNSVIGRVAAALVIVAACYIKGRIDEGLKTEARLEAQAASIHAAYKEATDAERARQASEAEAASQRAEAAKTEWEAERLRLRAELKQLSKGALDDKDAARDAFSVDAINRLNRLRFDRKPSGPRSLLKE